MIRDFDRLTSMTRSQSRMKSAKQDVASKSVNNRRAYGVSSLMLSTLVLSNENQLPAFAGGSPRLLASVMSVGGGGCHLDQYTDSDNNIETTYMLTLPEFSNDSRKSEIPEKIKCQSIEIGSHFYYRISENQWNELTKNFFEGKEKSKEKIKEVSFTYSELKELLGKD